MKSTTSHKLQLFLIMIYIFILPNIAVIYHYLYINPTFKEYLAKTSLHPYFYFCFNLLMVACLLSFISIIVITCKNTKKSIELDMIDSTQQTILKQEDEMKLLQEQILEKQAYIHSHIDLAINLCESEKYEEMTTLISALSSHVKRNYPDTYCKNILLNTLLQEKKFLADQLDVTCNFKIILPEHFEEDFSDFTITSIFSNLLDNALESCKQYREHHPQNDSLFIHLSTDYKTKMFMIQMKNSKDPDIPFTRQSTKDDSTLHGHGLSIIESIAKGYGGTCQWSVEDDSFLSLIMLKHT